MLAIIGFITLCSLSLLFVTQGIMVVYAYFGLTGKLGWPGVILLILGVAVGYYAVSNSPFHIVFN